ncbi:MAG: hypothetical protein JWR27_2677 [Aeromicrobium sp.]|nr:hypothetical protein [Aeromicrobium sp.]
MQAIVTSKGQPLTGEAKEKFRAADESLRKNYAGLDIDEFIPEIERSLGELEVGVPAGIVREYAQHISDRADYELALD